MDRHRETNGDSSTYGMDKEPLGKMLVAMGHLSEEQLSEGLTLQNKQAERLGEILCQLGHVDAQMVREALVQQVQFPTVDLQTHVIDPQAVAKVPVEVAFRYKVLPLSMDDNTLHIAMADPFDRTATEALRVLTGYRIERNYAPEEILLDTARRMYGSNVARMIADLDSTTQSQATSEEELSLQLQEMAQEPTVVNLVNLILLEAIDLRASDIHVEPFEKSIKIKYRIDGILHETPPPSKRLQPAIVSRIKVMAGMNIAERFVPQDGHITFKAPKGKVDLRVATMPSIFGECMVLRILDRSTALIDMEHLGLDAKCLELFNELLYRPHGIVLVTGPTGSGKTTTLYAALNRLFTPEKKIITIEEPVEYQLDGINQIPVNRKRGLTFANGLRAIVRQDPDIIMIGEIRDRETADIAIRSALTGHLVFSTLHTNDAAGAVTRLLDMGVEPFLLASSLEGVLAQRLVRTICPDCKVPAPPEETALRRIGEIPADKRKKSSFSRGEGCHTCRHTGYTGRLGIFELLRVTSEVRNAISERTSTTQIAAVAPADHQPMRLDGYYKAAEGITTLEEVLRVTQDTKVTETS